MVPTTADIARKSGRSQLQIRQLESELGLLSRADGSARFSMGETSVLVAVYGPADVKESKELYDRATVDVLVKPKSGLPGYHDKGLENAIHSAVVAVLLTQLHPRTCITIVVQIMHNGGSLLATALNGVGMALCDAGLAMEGMLTAVGMTLGQSASQLYLDPTLEEEKDARAVLTFSFKSSDMSGPLSCQVEGICETDEVLQAQTVAAKASQSLLAFLRLSLERKLSRELVLPSVAQPVK